MRKVAVTLALMALVLTACGEQGWLDGLGERSHDYVEGSTTIGPVEVSSTVAGDEATLVPVETVSWLNEAIAGEMISEPGITVSAVWARRGDSSRFVQASPAEIVLPLPGIQFPGLLPERSEWITSQLVFDTASATIDVNTSAAFGVWAGEPYAEETDQLAVLRVGQNINTGVPIGEIRALASNDGINLNWSDGAYAYELTCIAPFTERACIRMAESIGPLEAFAPPPGPAG